MLKMFKVLDNVMNVRHQYILMVFHYFLEHRD